jgi:hypothetical protein
MESRSVVEGFITDRVAEPRHTRMFMLAGFALCATDEGC